MTTADAFFSLKEIRKITNKSVLDFNRRYRKWSKEDSIQDNGVELSVSTYLASDIFETAEKRRKRGEKQNCYVTLETPLSNIKKWSDPNWKKKDKEKKKAKRKKRENHGRVDVAFFDKNECVVGVFEVKRYLDELGDEFFKDVKKITKLIENCGRTRGTLKWGAVVLFHSIWDGRKKNFRKRIEETLDGSRFKRLLERKTLRFRTVVETKYEKLGKRQWKKYEDGILQGFEAGCVLIQAAN